MNTTRKEINSFRNNGIFTDLGHELCRLGVVFEYISTGGNIINIFIGDSDGPNIGISEFGGTCLYPDDSGNYVLLHYGLDDHEPVDPEEKARVVSEIAYTVLGAISGGQIRQAIRKEMRRVG